MNEMDDGIAVPRTVTDRARVNIRQVLAGSSRTPWAMLSFAGPAIVASIAYMDPGNFATNIQAGAKYGYSLLWVVILANLIAMLFQMLSAKLGLVTGRNLAELCRATLPNPVVITMWALSEIAAMATDLAEFVGGAIGLSLLLHLPLLIGMVATALITYGLLMLDRAGFRPLELVIAALVCVIGLAYLAELIITPITWPAVIGQAIAFRHMDRGAVVLAVGIVGATVMPHVLFLHSGLTQDRVRPHNDRERTTLIAYSNAEVVIALGIAGLINTAMVIMAAGAFHAIHSDVSQIQTAYLTLSPLLEGAAALIFLTALIASGVSSSVVGTVAAQMVMQGFVGIRIPVWVRRLVAITPAFVVIGLGTNPTNALVVSQVVLSIALPAPMAMLIWLTSSQRVMGHHRNARVTVVIASLAAAAVILLNLVLVWQALA